MIRVAAREWGLSSYKQAETEIHKKLTLPFWPSVTTTITTTAGSITSSSTTTVTSTTS